MYKCIEREKACVVLLLEKMVVSMWFHFSLHSSHLVPSLSCTLCMCMCVCVCVCARTTICEHGCVCVHECVHTCSLVCDGLCPDKPVLG